MSSDEIDAYLAKTPEPQRSTLTAVRASIRSILPEADEGIAYGCPAFRVNGKAVAGFASYAHHCSYLPMSGSVLTTMSDDVSRYETSKGALKFAIDKPLPVTLLRKLIKARLAELPEETGKK